MKAPSSPLAARAERRDSKADCSKESKVRAAPPPPPPPPQRRERRKTASAKAAPLPPPPPPPGPAAAAGRSSSKQQPQEAAASQQRSRRRPRSVDCALITKTKSRREKNPACGGGLFFLPTDAAAPSGGAHSRGGGSSGDSWPGAGTSRASSPGSRSPSAIGERCRGMSDLLCSERWPTDSCLAAVAGGLVPLAAGAPLHSARLLRELRPTHTPDVPNISAGEHLRSSSMPASLPPGSAAVDGQRGAVRRRPPRVPAGKLPRLLPQADLVPTRTGGDPYAPPPLPVAMLGRSRGSGGSSGVSAAAMGAASPVPVAGSPLGALRRPPPPMC